MPDVVIAGAGISGLTTAYFLKKRNFNVTILEADSDVGGTMKSKFIDGYLIETGPNSALETTPLFKKIFDDTGILDDMVYAGEAGRNRYILRDGKLHPLPLNPIAFFKSKLWSFRGKLRVLAEPFHGKATTEETVAQFVRRRLGKEFLDYAINPFVAGVYAGDPEKLSIRSAFPKLYALEEKYGGLIIGTIKGARERRKRAEESKISAKMFSFRRGMGTFPKALSKYLDGSVLLDSKVKKISRSGDKFILEYEDRDGNAVKIDADVVVLSTPAYVTSKIIGDFAPELAELLDKIYYPPLSEVVLGYSEGKIGIELDGFGFLVPEKEGRRILGTIWSSSLFPDRAPEGYVELTTFVGGTRQPELALLSDDELVKIVSDELRDIMKIEGEPDFAHVTRWERAIPQYNLGHSEIMEAIEKFENDVSGIYLCANYRGGISVADCVMSAERTADRIIKNKKG